MKTMHRIFVAGIVTAVVFMAADFAWISMTSAALYQPVLAPHMAASYNWMAVGCFYPVYIAGIGFFAVRPLHDENLHAVFARGLLLGVVAYATYDLTNMATLSGWTWSLSLIDIAWGAINTGFSALLARIVLDKCAKKFPGH